MDREGLLREAAEDSLLREALDRRFIYADVESLIKDGYLCQLVSIAGKAVVLRTLPTQGYTNLLLRCEGDDPNWVRHHVAHSVHMVNGYVVQTDPNTPYHLFHEWLENTRIETITVLHAYVQGLQKRFGRACRITHAFCNEKYSRDLWARVAVPPDPTNVVQELWVAYNKAEDRFEGDVRQWQHTRSIAGSMSHKAAKALKKSEDNWTERRQNLARKTIEDAVNWVISGEREDQKPITVTVNGQTFLVPKIHASQSVGEMQEELMRAVRGEKDYHDHMVEQYKTFHKNRLEQNRKERAAALEKARQTIEASGISGRTTIVGYTPEQLAQINPEILRRPTARKQVTAPGQDRFDKYVQTDVEAGWIGLGGRPEAATPMEGETPKEESLQDRISRRKPRLKS